MDKKSTIAMATVTITAFVLLIIISVDYSKKDSQEMHVTHKSVETATIEKHAPVTLVKENQQLKDKETSTKKSVTKKEKVKQTIAKKDEKPKETTSGGSSSKVADVIKMENKAYSKHKKGIVLFTHKKHTVDYKIGCGECHHDGSGTPLNDLKIDDDVENCIACHSEPGQKRGKASKEEKLEYHAEAIHMNCILCHKKYNKKNKTKAAPQSCSKCHPKK